jgi:hypothetical protein
LTTASTGVGIQSAGQRKATLTTNATELVSDTQIAAPGLRLTGALSASGQTATVGALTATSLALGGGTLSSTGAVNVASVSTTGTISGAALSISGAGSINGVSFQSGSWVSANSGYVAQAGYFSGDSGQAMMGYRNPSSGVPSSTYLSANSTRFNLFGGQGILWYTSGGSAVAWISPVIVSGGDPGFGNYPDGTIWIQP